MGMAENYIFHSALCWEVAGLMELNEVEKEMMQKM